MTVSAGAARLFRYFNVVAAPGPAFFYKRTSLGRVRISPDLG
jgi:hypothetical protein